MTEDAPVEIGRRGVDADGRAFEAVGRVVNLAPDKWGVHYDRDPPGSCAG